jgi:hypothetical protein
MSGTGVELEQKLENQLPLLHLGLNRVLKKGSHLRIPNLKEAEAHGQGF